MARYTGPKRSRTRPKKTWRSCGSGRKRNKRRKRGRSKKKERKKWKRISWLWKMSMCPPMSSRKTLTARKMRIIDINHIGLIKFKWFKKDKTRNSWKKHFKPTSIVLLESPPKNYRRLLKTTHSCNKVPSSSRFTRPKWAAILTLTFKKKYKFGKNNPVLICSKNSNITCKTASQANQ